MNCRKAVAVVLLMFMALEILPCGYLEAPALATGALGSFACSVESLQVCDSGDSLLGALANIPVLVPGATMLILPPEIHFLVPDLTSFVPEGFCPSIDHPPQLSS
jgi:hypothetical protein